MPDEVKVEVAPEEKDTSQEKVDVTPETKLSEQDALVARVKADVEALAKSQVQQLQSQFDNFRHGAYRIQDDLRKEVERLKTQVATPPKVSDTTDPWAKIEDGHVWKSEIEKLAEQKAEEKLRAWQAQQQTQALLQQQQQSLESSKQQVVAKYPDLDPESGDPSTLISQTYAKVLNEHPDWTTNPYGPVLTMYAMEESLKQANASAPSGGSAKSRASAASLPPSRPAPSGGERMTLTREQKAFCDRHKMKYEDFLKTATALEQGAVEA